MAISQAERPFRVETDLGTEDLLLEGFTGTESISSPFMFHVDMVSEDPDIDTEALLRTPISLTVRMEDDSERKIHGVISRVVQRGMLHGFASYRAEMVPWFWFLGLNLDSRIFQKKTVIEIVESVFGDRGEADYEIRCGSGYPTLEYCVQYRESDLAFIQRLLEREGIFYYFRHDDDKHVMVIADDKSAFEKNPHQPTLRYRSDDDAGGEVITSFQREHSVHVGKVTLADYDPLQPTLDVSASLSGKEKQEHYDYPGAYAKHFCNDAGDVAGEAERYARIRLELMESRRHLSRAQGNCRGVLVGSRVTLEEHYRRDANGEYVITSISHSAQGAAYRSSDAPDVEYRNGFTVIDARQPFRPERRTVKPIVEGTQTAVVVGPKGEEVFTDKHGRVKCQFHWDREGENNEDSSCWIRVATPWAGKGYGAVSIPRIGNEVVVDFLEGDPDQPLVVGSVYNADQSPPFALPDADIQMGMKTRSSKGGGGYNEISLTDTKGKELITIHAQFDMNTTVEHDETLTVHNNRTQKVDVDESIEIGNDQMVAIGNDRSENVGADEKIVIGANRTETVGKDESISVGGNRSTTINKNEEISVDGSRNEKVTKDEVVEIGGSRKVEVEKDETVSVGGNRKTSVKGNDQLNVAKKLTLEAKDEITLKAGKASIVLKKSGDIMIKGKKITVKGSGDVVVKGSKVKAN